MIFIGIIFIIVAILLIIGVITIDNPDNSFGRQCRAWGGTFGAILLMVVGLAILTFKPSEPTSLDVYRGKTELRIEQKVVNNQVVSSDSIVVWKK